MEGAGDGGRIQTSRDRPNPLLLVHGSGTLLCGELPAISQLLSFAHSQLKLKAIVIVLLE